MKNLVIFDGSNFYHYMKKLMPKLHLTDFNYRKLAEEISSQAGCDIKYCVGEIKQDRSNLQSKKLYANQQKLFGVLGNQSIAIHKGYMLKSRGVFHEKGTDVRIAIEILRGALKNEYNQCFLISSDTDLIPAIADAKEQGKKVTYVGFSNSISKAMKANCSDCILITKKMVNKINKK